MGVEIVIRIPDSDAVPKKLLKKIEKAGYEIVDTNEIVDINETPFKVRITADVLNVRAQPTILSPCRTKARKDEIYTITSVIDEWYRLKSGVGYIHSKYTERID